MDGEVKDIPARNHGCDCDCVECFLTVQDIKQICNEADFGLLTLLKGDPGVVKFSFYRVIEMKLWRIPAF